MTAVLATNLLIQAIRALLPVGALRNGQVVEARVNAMLSKDVARLTLLGATLDVDTPVQLVPGSMIKVAIERTGDHLRLVLQRDANAPASQLAVSPTEEDAGAGGFRSLSIAIAKAAIDDATSAGEPDAPQQPESAADVSVGRLGSEAQTAPPDRAPTALNSGSNQVTLAPQPRASSLSTADGSARAVALAQFSTALSEPSGNTKQASNTQFAAGTISYLPSGGAQPLNLTVSRDEVERHAGNQVAESGFAWTVRFSFDSPGLGPIHAAIRLSAGGIGVKLWAERPDVAKALDQDSAELRSSLQKAAIDVEAVAVLPGRPPDQEVGRTV
jgi:Flagellar hook-length control protein FliK